MSGLCPCHVYPLIDNPYHDVDINVILNNYRDLNNSIHHGVATLATLPACVLLDKLDTGTAVSLQKKLCPTSLTILGARRRAER